MRKTMVSCLAAIVLASGGVCAQTSQGLDRAQHVSDPGLRRVSSQLFRPTVASPRLSLAKVPALVTAPSAQRQTRVRASSRMSRNGALIGLAVGAAASAVYWATSNCRYGSDSSSAIVSRCVVPTGAMIAGGWYIGAALGR